MLFCYRLKGDKGTHYGPFEAKDQPDFLERIRSFYGKDRMDGMEYWAIAKKEDHLYPPAPGSGVDIWGFDWENGRRIVRQA